MAVAIVAAIGTVALAAGARASAPVKVGSKRFVESYVLAEIVTQLVRAEGDAAEHERGLGGTAVVFRALTDGAIDVYPEYTGTLAETVVKVAGPTDLASLRAALEPRGLALSEPLGFENTYALAVRRKTAHDRKLSAVSDLAGHPELRVTLSHEFMGRSDGWPGLATRYGLRPVAISAIDHALAYEAIANESTDVIDVYTTDAKIARFDLTVLTDDRAYFPPYQAVLVYRADLPARAPAFARALERVQGKMDARTMQQLNAQADLEKIELGRVAKSWIDKSSVVGGERSSVVAGTLAAIVRHGPRHLLLVGVAVALSTLVGVPLGMLAHANRRTGAVVLAVTGIVQTIPSLAMFCFLIPLLGIGAVPALVALFAYGLLPIVRNTHAGLASIGSELREAATAIGLSPVERLRYIELPLASRTIVAGIKTSAVVAVGSATIAAFIGAGGFGEPISTGLSLNDVPMILEGAIPAAGLALLVEGVFTAIERAVVPVGLRER